MSQGCSTSVQSQGGGLLDEPFIQGFFSHSEYCNIMTTTSLNPQWDLKRKVLVYAPDSTDPPDSQAFLSATLLMSHDIETKQGIISIRVTLHNPNPTCASQVLTLAFPPKSVTTCSWIPKSNDNLCPARLLAKVPRNSGDVSNVSTLSLQLRTTAEAFVPYNMKPLSPHTQSISDFHALEKISTSNILYIHFGKDQVTKKEIPLLQRFLHALRDCSVEVLRLDLKRHGLIEGALHNYRPPSFPPPYSEKSVSEQEELPAYCADSVSEQVVGKPRIGTIPFPHCLLSFNGSWIVSSPIVNFI